MVIDTSALIAILRREPEADGFLRQIVQAETRLLSAVGMLETTMVLVGRAGGAQAAEVLDALLKRARVDIVAFDQNLAAGALAAFVRFGKGRHPAGLNLGDCAAYALAKTRGLPLLFKGNDFVQTDIVRARSI
jgi:ribonuclease VapC